MDLYDDYSGELLGTYELKEKLGNGCFGAVYRVWDTVLKTEKAVKILDVYDPVQAEELFKEAEIPYKCRHNNIVKINGGQLIDFEDDCVFVIDMDLCSDGSVEDRIEQETLTVIDSLNIVKDVLYGLEHAHMQGIIHRDIKPANILIDKRRAKLSDFGLSAVKGDYVDGDWYIVHTAPEVFDSSTATVASDIYAVGVTLFRMVNNYSDWKDRVIEIKDINKVLRKGTLIKNIGYRDYIPKKVRKIINKACNPDAGKRYASAKEMRNAIEKLQYLFNWYRIDDMSWGVDGKKGRTLSIKKHRGYVETVLEVNGRKSNKDSHRFSSIEDAEAFCCEYISENTVV